MTNDCICYDPEEASWWCRDGVHQCAEGCDRFLTEPSFAENCAFCLDREEHKGHGSPCEDDPEKGSCAGSKLKDTGTSKRPQVGGNHYEMAIEPIDFILANGMCYTTGNVLKYISRWRSKGGIEDLLKARSYLDMLLEDARSNPERYGLDDQGLPEVP